MARPRPRKRAAFAQRLVIMAKSPFFGVAKRRLGSEIGATRATRFYRTCLAHTVWRLASDPRWKTLLAVTPDKEVAQDFSDTPTAPPLSQSDGNSANPFQRLFERLPPGP